MIKKILRWLILGGTLFFLAKALKDNWQGIAAIRIDAAGWAIIAIATGVTLLGHTWAGWIWTWILRNLNQPVPSVQFIQIYLQTNIGKYLPGNVWHYYGRIMAAKNANVSTSAATLSVLLEPLLMAAAALIVALLGSLFVKTNTNLAVHIGQILGLFVVLCVLHPRFLNLLIRLLHRLKTKKSDCTTTSDVSFTMEHYPLQPLLGEIGFLGLRGIGFILIFYALSPVNSTQIPLLFTAFSFAWLLGLVVPGAPGGLGVFEATAIALLQNYFPAAVVISATGVYRLVSILAETLGAGLAWLDERLFR
ncbi:MULTISPECIES: lysylphosphatidylglycerol synthase domain-containing protein [Fischerella]|uniref:lysylphosphatidylglycerol synthase domain-containing protein n=1 Tax=Fischerella TaxID=1190 RepID=UPI000300345D|nr:MULTISPECIES: lysylphosphatidylglycerol synthase domain-containing protein [Fischerella]MBD2431318.1 flippase-like domain-containing protein [Fischerella sp. FACHB-380]